LYTLFKNDVSVEEILNLSDRIDFEWRIVKKVVTEGGGGKLLQSAASACVLSEANHCVAKAV
jgi:N-glycosylase/DNA lyase